MRPAPDVADLVTFAIEAERAGLDAVMVSEHVVLGPSANAAGRPANPRDYALPGNQDPATPWPSPLVLLSAIAAATTRIRLVAGALISPLRHPLATAKDLATLDRLSGGRLVVQPTVSWHRDEYDALGVPFGQRGEILDEQLEIWAKAWNGSPVEPWREALLVRAHLGRATASPPRWSGPVVRRFEPAPPADRPPGPVRERLQPARPGRGPGPAGGGDGRRRAAAGRAGVRGRHPRCVPRAGRGGGPGPGAVRRPGPAGPAASPRSASSRRSSSTTPRRSARSAARWRPGGFAGRVLTVDRLRPYDLANPGRRPWPSMSSRHTSAWARRF